MAPRTNRSGNPSLQCVMESKPFRLCQAALIGLLIVLFGEPLEAAENCFPRGKSVTFIIPYGVGSLENLYARMFKTVAEQAIGSQFNPKNIPARGALEGITALYSARPSGRTLGVLNTVDAVVAALAGAVPFETQQFSIFGRIVDTPQAVYAAQPTFDKGIKSMKDASAALQTLAWGITTPGSFFAAAVLDDLFGIEGTFNRVSDSARSAVKAAVRGDVDLLVMDTQSGASIGKGDIIPILALGPGRPAQNSFEKHRVPMLEEIASSDNVEKALSLARITASGLMIAGPPHIPGLRAKCIQVGFEKALRGPDLRALATAAGKPVHPLDAEAAAKLLHKVAEEAVPFESMWVDALRQLNAE